MHIKNIKIDNKKNKRSMYTFQSRIEGNEENVNVMKVKKREVRSPEKKSQNIINIKTR